MLQTLSFYKISGMTFFRFAKLFFILSFYVLLNTVECDQEVDGVHSRPLKVYEYYVGDGIESGLQALPSGFQLNKKNITIQSGAIHYFRVHPAYWQDRLRKLRATGLIAVETYVPWNLHEPKPGQFDFGDGDNDFSEFLNLTQFLKLAQEEDLLVLLRPGPYICAEWEFGGFPSWLLQYDGIKLRTSEKQYIERVNIYFTHLLNIVKGFQFTNNGPIIAFQVENEYVTSGVDGGPDKEYLKILKGLFDDSGIVELLYTSDSALSDSGTLPEFLHTVNFQTDANQRLQSLVGSQPDKPPMVMEFWTGWYDTWMRPASHTRFPPDRYAAELEAIMSFPASFNLYMFHGGTSFGFLNGGNGGDEPGQIFMVTSYDYDAPLSESGDYTEKYTITSQLVFKYSDQKFLTPDRPINPPKIAYPNSSADGYVELFEIYDLLADVRENHKDLVNMEKLSNGGQSYGFIWYRKANLNVKSGQVLNVTGYFRDIGHILLDNKLQTGVLNSNNDTDGFGFFKTPNDQLTFKDDGKTLDIIVENYGRINFGSFTYNQKKGLFDGPVSINGNQLEDWEITPLDFNKRFIKNLTTANEVAWKEFNSSVTLNPGPRLFRFTLKIDDKPSDTFLDMRSWNKGVVFINGFNLGRFNKLGPQRTLYVPAPLLEAGENTIVVFEQFANPGILTFSETPILT